MSTWTLSSIIGEIGSSAGSSSVCSTVRCNFRSHLEMLVTSITPLCSQILSEGRSGRTNLSTSKLSSITCEIDSSTRSSKICCKFWTWLEILITSITLLCSQILSEIRSGRTGAGRSTICSAVVGFRFETPSSALPPTALSSPARCSAQQNAVEPCPAQNPRESGLRCAARFGLYLRSWSLRKLRSVHQTSQNCVLEGAAVVLVPARPTSPNRRLARTASAMRARRRGETRLFFKPLTAMQRAMPFNTQVKRDSISTQVNKEAWVKMNLEPKWQRMMHANPLMQQERTLLALSFLLHQSNESAVWGWCDVLTHDYLTRVLPVLP